MASFSIDDVRDTIAADVGRLLAVIETDVRHVLDVRLPWPDDEAAPESPFDGVRDSGHAIFGTAALVGVETLSTSAKLVEDLAELGKSQLALAELHLSKARRIAAILADAAAEMRVMLTLELEHRDDDAHWVALAWQERAQDALADGATAASAVRQAATSRRPESAVAAELDEEDAFPEDPDAPEGDAGAVVAQAPDADNDTHGQEGADAAEAASDRDAAEQGNFFEFAFTEEPEAPVPDELAAVFREEARELLVALQQNLEVLTVTPSDPSAAAQAERLFHTLKGASATVGMREISARAAQLQQGLERVVDGTTTADAAFVTALVAQTNELLDAAGLPHVDISAATGKLGAAGSPDAEEPRLHFRAEARQVHAEASRAVESIADSPEASEEACKRLEVLFHRLKGSALVADEPAVVELARSLEQACRPEAGGPPSTAELSRGLARLAVLLRLGATAVDVAPPAVDLSEAHPWFIEEARQILADVRRVMDDASVGTRSDLDWRVDLGKLFHRLKGSALVVGEMGIGTAAAELERLCETASPAGDIRAIVGAKVDALNVAVGGARSTHAPSEGAVPEGSESVDLERHAVEVVSDAELWQAFVQECGELLDALDKNILTLEDADDPKETLRAVLRGHHTLKGIVNTIGLGPTGRVLHRVEDFIEGLLDAPILPAMRGVVTFLLAVQVDVRRNLKQARSGYVETSLPKLEARMARALSSKAARRPHDADRSSRADSSAGQASFGSEASAGSGHHEREERRFIRVSTEHLDMLMNLAGELVVSRSRLVSRVSSLRTMQIELGRGGRRLTETIDAFREENEFAKLDGRSPLQQATREALSVDGGASLAIASAPTTASHWGFSELELDRYEDIHILARRLAEINSDFTEISADIARGLSSFADDADVFGRIVSGIQSEVTRARMVPLELLFSRLRLPIRDAAMRETKEVRVVTVGEDVSLDKTIADALFQPMLHLVRNAVVHGVETAARRDAVSKARTGTITLRARQESGQIVLEVRDDGGGLNLAKLRDRGVAMGLIAEGTPVDDPSVKELIFVTGLSTREGAGAVAGRGVGCDVVRRAIERLNGSIRVETVLGKGTAFVINLPITLAITKSLLVRQGGRSFAVPLYFAERIIEWDEATIVESAGVRRVKVDDSYLPVTRLAELFGGTAGQASQLQSPVLLLRVGDQRLALQVDAIVGQEEIVVKSLGDLLTGHPLFAGVTIRGTGELVLIVDVPGLMNDGKGGVTVTRRMVSSRERTVTATDELGGTSLSAELGEGVSAAKIEPVVEGLRTGKIRALFVDDSLSVRKVAEMALVGLGVDVTLAVDGVDALERLRQGSFDIVFTDLEMPRMHGYELIRELRFLPAFQDLPVVVVTSRSGQKHQDQARALGATDYLTKPFNAQSLDAALTRWVRAHARRDRGDVS